MNGIEQLEDRELDQLLSAVLAEQKRRGKKRFASAEGQQRERKVHASPLALTSGQINAVRSAFKAGVYARYFERGWWGYSH